MNLTTRIARWTNGRAACIEREADEGGSSRWAEEIQSFDDGATQLLTEAAPIIEAAEWLMGLDMQMWADGATAFTCIEAEAIADLLRLTHDDQTATDFLLAHAIGDDEGDSHTHLLDAATTQP
jgi:hypothetical protein